MIQLESVSKGYGGQALFRDLTWTITSGERIGLEGAAAFLVGDQARLGHEPLELAHDVVPPRQNRGIWARQGDLRHDGSGKPARRWQRALTLVFRMGRGHGQEAGGNR